MELIGMAIVVAVVFYYGAKLFVSLFW